MTYDVELLLDQTVGLPRPGGLIELHRRRDHRGWQIWVLEPNEELCQWLLCYTSSLEYIHEIGDGVRWKNDLRKPRGLLFAFRKSDDAVLMKLRWA
jgi:hypothetical protein